MRFVFDENISDRIVRALRDLDYPCLHSTDLVSRGATDEELIAAVRAADAFLVTQDRQIARRPHQRAALFAAGIGAFVFTGRAADSIKTLALLIQKVFPEMEARAESTPRPFVFTVTDRGHFDLTRARRQ